MKAEDVQLGMFVQVQRDYSEAVLRDRIGIVRQRYGNESHSPFKVRFEDVEARQLRLLWAGDFEEA
jgi:hypothetical protein